MPSYMHDTWADVENAWCDCGTHLEDEGHAAAHERWTTAGIQNRYEDPCNPETIEQLDAINHYRAEDVREQFERCRAEARAFGVTSRRIFQDRLDRNIIGHHELRWLMQLEAQRHGPASSAE